ncbi:MAG: toll/interleukin-1 receptor domain-containing protein [Chloroflexota bacterium]|nr:toll/interleukin-1 receptor domain-containing protein [Chloroflexota bacterium]MDE2947108.1 toll/interleukin-1 receptor domain-containing protein [Chloroflexota bacterium]
MARHILSKDKYEYDVFLSHASEDKDEVARPLAIALQKHGLRVWYDEFELRIGDNLVAKLNAGISTSRFGILVLSKAFFAKQWTIHELNMLENLWVSEDRILFPVWHKITVEELSSYRAWLAIIIGLSTDTYEIKEIADEICEVIIKYDPQDLATKGHED